MSDKPKKTLIFIIRDWEKRGIRTRHAVKVEGGTAYTDEDRGDGVKWTPYSMGFDAFATWNDAFLAARQLMDNQLNVLKSEGYRLEASMKAIVDKEEKRIANATVRGQ